MAGIVQLVLLAAAAAAVGASQGPILEANLTATAPSFFFTVKCGRFGALGNTCTFAHIHAPQRHAAMIMMWLLELACLLLSRTSPVCLTASIIDRK